MYLYDNKREGALPLTPSALLSRFDIHYLDALQIEPALTEKLTLKSQRLLQKKHIKAENDWISALYLQDFLNKNTPKLMIKWINHRIGYGLYALETIPAFTYIGEYAGLVRPRQRADRYNNYAFRYSIAQKDTRYLIDAKTHGSLIRFINHSDEPNCASHWMIHDLCHIIFHTTKAIPAGTQITFDYGPYYWRTRGDPKSL